MSSGKGFYNGGTLNVGLMLGWLKLWNSKKPLVCLATMCVAATFPGTFVHLEHDRQPMWLVQSDLDAMEAAQAGTRQSSEERIAIVKYVNCENN